MLRRRMIISRILIAFAPLLGPSARVGDAATRPTAPPNRPGLGVLHGRPVPVWLVTLRVAMLTSLITTTLLAILMPAISARMVSLFLYVRLGIGHRIGMANQGSPRNQQPRNSYFMPIRRGKCGDQSRQIY